MFLENYLRREISRYKIRFLFKFQHLHGGGGGFIIKGRIIQNMMALKRSGSFLKSIREK